MKAAIRYNVPATPSILEPVYAVIYARYSSHGQTEQSIEGQLAKGHEYAAAKGYTVVHEYIDRAMTGRNDNREQFQKMLSDTAKHQFSVIIVWKVDRFGRNREEIAFNKHTCKKNGVRVEYVAESLPNAPEAVILESVLEGMAEYYSLQLSQNILIPFQRMDIEHHRSGCVGIIRDMDIALRELPDEPGLHSAE